MQKIIQISTDKHNCLLDITNEGMTNIYVQGATAAIMIQENWNYSVQNDVVTLLNKLIPSGI